MLYNNVGVSYDHAELLQELSDEKIQVLCLLLFLLLLMIMIIIIIRIGIIRMIIIIENAGAFTECFAGYAA